MNYQDGKLERVTLWVIIMVTRFSDNGLKNFFRTGSKTGVNPAQAARLRLIPGMPNAAAKPQELNLPGLRLHLLEPKATGVWAVDASGNWRVTFQLNGADVINVNYCDYH